MFYIATDFSQPYVALSLTATVPASSARWKINVNGILSLQLYGSGFCTTQQGQVIITFGGWPPFTCLSTTLDVVFIFSGD
jgi:hypothetical protein